MKRAAVFCALLSICAAATVAAAAGKQKRSGKALPAKLVGLIDKIEAAHAAGNSEGVWRILAPAVGGFKEDTAAKFDEALSANSLPTARELLVQARMKLLIEGRLAALPAPALRERILILQCLPGTVQQPLVEMADNPLVNESAEPPETMAEFDQRFREIRQLRGELRVAQLGAVYAAELAASLPQSARKRLTDDERQFVEQCESGLSRKVEQAEADMRELEIETHLLRLRYGVDALKSKKLNPEKFVAAASARRDVQALREALATPDGKGNAASTADAQASTQTSGSPFRRAPLAASDLLVEVEKLSEEAVSLAGGLADKAERFAVGLDAWLRGRYGFGPDVWGLAKSEQALKDEELLKLVFMPPELPEQSSTEPRTTESPQFPDRRHHYTWAWEDRRLMVSGDRTIRNAKESVDLTPDRTSPSGRDIKFEQGFYPDGRHWVYCGHDYLHTNLETKEYVTTVTVPAQDPRLVYRIVGFLEFIEAIQYLEKFVEEATLPELEVADELIKSHDEYRIATNLSRAIEKQSTLSESPLNPRDDFSRHGLEWVLALARVEVGAMLAGFTSHENPFLALAPSVYRQERVKTVPYGSAAFAEMLLDGLRTHYWSIASGDLIANYYKNGVPENHLLTYGRRAIVGRHFLKAVLAYSGAGNSAQNLPPEQKKELEKWEQTFIKLQRIMLYCLTYKVGSQKVSHYELTSNKNLHGSWMGIERDQTPDAIRRILTTADPTLIGCGCK